jgi:flavodoxin
VTQGTSTELVKLGGPETTVITARGRPGAVGRRAFLRGALAGTAGIVLGAQIAGCSASSAEPGRTESGGNRTLLAYFSRAGENYYYGGRTQLAVGNTEVLAGMMGGLIACDVYRIEPVDPYPVDYEETVRRNVQEQEAGARPAIANPLVSIEGYNTVLLGSPIWNVRAPMIMATFAESFDLTGKTIFPFTTYAVNGLGTTLRDYAALCPGATIGEGIAVRGEEVGATSADVESWLRRTGVLTS